MSFLSLNLLSQDPSRNKTNRKILLIEPNYSNKYPPLGLMKLSAYHKQLGDTVIFFKGDYSKFILDEKIEKCLEHIKLQGFDLQDWNILTSLVCEYLKHKRKAIRENILRLIPDGYVHTVEHLLNGYASSLPERKWDRIYITTLFTFYWKQTINAINFAKKIIKSSESIYLGGVAASLIPDLFEKESGLKIGENIIIGLLDKPGILDDNNFIIDELTPDYSILETIEYRYPLDTGYLGYTTKGCRRGCEFCAVPTLEPEYKDYRPLQPQIQKVLEKHEIRKDLILMDNNVLDSSKFSEIIHEILDLGFTKDAQYIEPNRFEILVAYLQNSNKENEPKYLQQIHEFLLGFGKKRIRNQRIFEKYEALLYEKGLDTLSKYTKENVLDSKNELNEFIEKFRNKNKKRRYVDFNQGFDCRYIDEEKMRLLSQLPIMPMRIAFDRLTLRNPYERAIRLAVKYGIRHLSNYILFNYEDTPEELWDRLKINQDLNIELQIKIYSFPMKFVPMKGEEAKGRAYVGKHWNPKFLRAIQCILNVTKTGVVMDRPAFFEKAFGRNLEEYQEILLLPEAYIMNRLHFEENGMTEKWRNQFKNFTQKQKNDVLQIIYSNYFSHLQRFSNKAMAEFMEHYTYRE